MHVHFLLIQVSSFYLEPFSHDNNKSQGFLPSCHTKVSTHLGGGGGGESLVVFTHRANGCKDILVDFVIRTSSLGGWGKYMATCLKCITTEQSMARLYYSSSKAPHVF